MGFNDLEITRTFQMATFTEKAVDLLISTPWSSGLQSPDSPPTLPLGLYANFRTVFRIKLCNRIR